MSFTVDSAIDKLTLNSDFKDSADGTVFPARYKFNDQTKLAGRTLVPTFAGEGVFDVTISEGLPAGAVTLSHELAAPGTVVTTTAHPDKYKYSELTVVKESGGNVKLTQMSEDVYAFAMPADNVEVVLDKYGRDSYEIETQDGAPVIDSSNMADVVGATLTQKELDAGYILLLVSSPLSGANIPSADKTALESQAK